MKKFYSVLLSVLLTWTSVTVVQAQEETQWANRVIEVSSAYKQGILFKESVNYNQYPADRILGLPDVLPGNYGDSPNSWMPQRPDGKSSVKLGFDFPIKIQQIAIAESRNPGALSEIYAYDLEGKEYLVADLDPAPVNAGARVFNVFINPTPYEVYAVKLVMDGDAVPGYNAIDAVAISSSPIPVDAKINVADGINPDLVAQKIDYNTGSDISFINLKPIIAPDGNTLFFSRQSDKNVGGPADPEDIWYLERTGNGTWSEPLNPGKPLNNRGSNFVSSVSQGEDGYVLVLGNAYQDDGKMTSGVSISERSGDEWTKPQALNIENFYNYAMSANYSLSNNQRYLLMSVERDDTRGTRDLYISFNKGNNNWSEPINLGNQVNTPDLETSPFLASDDSTLFFSSRGYGGFGGEDVYMTHRLDDTWQNWSTPQNLGPDINSGGDDTFFNIALNEDYAYLTRGTIDDADLFRMDMPIFKAPSLEFVVQGQVYNVKNNMPVEAEVVVRSTANTDEEVVSSSSQEDGNYQLNLSPGQYEIFARKDGYNTVEQQSITIEEGDNVILRDLYLIDDFSDINISEELSSSRSAIASEEVLFNYNEYQLNRRAYKQLEEVAEFMNQNKDVTLRIVGHTCDIGSRQFNDELSEKRAKAVAEFLSNQGITSSRLRTQGAGETDPMVPNSTSGNRKINRRVEFKILE